MRWPGSHILLASKFSGRFDAIALRLSVKRWTKILLALVGLVVLGVASIPFSVNANTFRPIIESQLTTTFGRSVKLGDLSGAWRLALFSGSLDRQRSYCRRRSQL